MSKPYLASIRRELQYSRKDLRWLVFGALLVPTMTLIVDSIALLFGLFFPLSLPRVGAVLLTGLALMWAYCLLLRNDLQRHKQYLKLYAPADFDIDSAEDFDTEFEDEIKNPKY